MTARERDPQGVSGPAARLEAIRERLAKATPGPWAANEYGLIGAIEECAVIAQMFSRTDEDFVNAHNNGRFIAHAWEDIAWLLARLAPATPQAAAIAEHSPDETAAREERTP